MKKWNKKNRPLCSTKENRSREFIRTILEGRQ